MTLDDIAIGVLVNIVTGFIVYWATETRTTKKEKQAFQEEARKSRESTADSAIGHLRSSYLAVKKLELEVLGKARQHSKEDSSFHIVLWGIAQSLEQIRLGLQGHMNAWKGDLDRESDSFADVQKFLREDILESSISVSGSAVSSSLVQHYQQQQTNQSFGQSRTVAEGMAFTLSTLIQSPAERALRDMQEGRFNDAARQADIIIKQRGSPAEILFIGGLLATSGQPSGLAAINHLLSERYAELDSSARVAALSAVANYHQKVRKEDEGLQVIGPIASKILSEPDLEVSDRAVVHAKVGTLYLGANQWSNAIEHMEKAVELEPTNADYKFFMAKAYESLGDDSKADIWYNKAIDTGKADSDVMLGAVVFFSKQGNHARAAQILAALEQVDPMRASVAMMAMRKNNM